ncbi:MAG: C25 family cysteine peptidase [bacterium]|nr:C25 family cysteine peptidase [bacterium]
MNKYKVGILLCLLSIGMVSYAGTLKKTFVFDTGNLSFSQSDGFDVVKIKGGQLTEKTGEPQLPSKMVQLSIPSNAKLENVIINSTQYEDIPGTYNVYPAQAPQAISDISEETKSSFTTPDAKIYNSSAQYPEKLIEYGEENMGGYKIVYINIYPVTYTPSEKKLKLYSKIDLTINYKEDKSSTLRKTELGKEVFRKMVREIVDNPEDVINNEVSFLPVLADTAEYLIVTGDALTEEFQRLADWKIAQGLTVQVKTVSWILSNYTTGRDNAEKIWYFLKDYFANHGTVYVTLGGDTNIVPVRRCWGRVVAKATDTKAIIDDKWMNCELYYSDLNGPWNSNNDANWGDPWYDSIPDMSPDVIVGRLPAGDATEAHTLMDKQYTYMTTAPTDTYLLNMTGKVSIDPSSMFNPRMDAIATEMPTKYHFTKFYESAGNGGKAKALAQLNTGPHFVCWASHGDSVSLHTNGAVNDPVKTADALGLTNGTRLFILNTLACRVVRLTHNDCVAEGFMLAPNGGAIAFIGNGCTGLNSQSDTYMDQMAVAMFKDNENPIGYAFSTTKAARAASAHSSDREKALQYGLNLLGDPAMAIFNGTQGIEAMPDFIGQMAKIYPNPARGDAKFRLLGVAKGVKVSLQIYDLSGAVVKSFSTITDNSPVTTLTWDRRDDTGKKLKTGVYFYKVKNNSYEQKGKFVLL